MLQFSSSLDHVDEALSRLTETLATLKGPADVEDEVGPAASHYPTTHQNGHITPAQALEEDYRANEPRYAIDADFSDAVDPNFRSRIDLSTKDFYPNITNDELRTHLNWLHELHELRNEDKLLAYSIGFHLKIASIYFSLGYPDLAIGSAYKALLLIDAVNDESDEYHACARRALRATIALTHDAFRRQILKSNPDVLARYQHSELRSESYETQGIGPLPQPEEYGLWANEYYARDVYLMLSRCLHTCGSQLSAYKYVNMGLNCFPDDTNLLKARTMISDVVNKHYLDAHGLKPNGKRHDVRPEDFPEHGLVRRECYPWNKHEPNRLSEQGIDFLNAQMAEVAPKLEVRATELPILSRAIDGPATLKQLGVFAKDDVASGEVVLRETSLLTATNRLLDPLCDACSADLPNATAMSAHAAGLNTPLEVVACEDCPAVFCSQRCHDLAQESYHPALCDKDVEAIAKDVPPAQAADALYTLLLLRALAMAETQDLHPLDLAEVRYIWGDYSTADVNKLHANQLPPPRTLPFSFQHNVVLPFHMLEKMDVDIFASPHAEIWVFNTLYAKFRGTASARLSGNDGRPVRGPEVSAVHPLWCLANHSCDPNVSWEWGGSIKFWAREERVEWQRDGKSEAVVKRTYSGLKKGDEVLNHYCDVELGVKDRREWASGALGGDCCCERCAWEAGEAGT